MRKSSWSVFNVIDLKNAFESAHKQRLAQHLKDIITYFKSFKDDTVSIEALEIIFEAYDAFLKRDSLDFSIDDLKKQLHQIRHDQRESKQFILSVENDFKILEKKAFASALFQNDLLTRADVESEKRSLFHHFDIVVIIFGRVSQKRIATLRFSDIVKKINDVIDLNDTVRFFFDLSQKTLNQWKKKMRIIECRVLLNKIVFFRAFSREISKTLKTDEKWFKSLNIMIRLKIDIYEIVVHDILVVKINFSTSARIEKMKIMLISENRKLQFSYLNIVKNIFHLSFIFKKTIVDEKERFSLFVDFKHWQDVNWIITEEFRYDDFIHVVDKYTQKRKITQCFFCWNFEHIENRCTVTRKCEQCAFDDHDTKNCESLIRKCVNCDASHVVDFRECRHVIVTNQKKAQTTMTQKHQLYDDFDKKIMSSSSFLLIFIFSFREFCSDIEIESSLSEFTNISEEIEISTNEFLNRNIDLMKLEAESQFTFTAMIFFTSRISLATKKINEYLMTQFLQISQRNEKFHQRSNEFTTQTLLQLIKSLQIAHEFIRQINAKLNVLFAISVNLNKKNTINDKYFSSEISISLSNDIIKVFLTNRKRKILKINISSTRTSKKIRTINKLREFTKKIESIDQISKFSIASDHEDVNTSEVNNVSTSESNRYVFNENEINNNNNDASSFSFFTESSSSNESQVRLISIEFSEILMTWSSASQISSKSRWSKSRFVSFLFLSHSQIIIHIHDQLLHILLQLFNCIKHSSFASQTRHSSSTSSIQSWLLFSSQVVERFIFSTFCFFNSMKSSNTSLILKTFSSSQLTFLTRTTIWKARSRWFHTTSTSSKTT